MPQTKNPLKPITLFHSDSILLHPDGSIDDETLENLLYDVTEQSLPRSARVSVTREKRVNGFNPDRPEWINVTRVVTVGYLFKTYKEMHNQEYSHPTSEEKRQRERDELKKYQRQFPFY